MLRKSNFYVILTVLILALARRPSPGCRRWAIQHRGRPGNGYPQWYTDANGVTVDFPIPPLGNGLTAPTMIYAPVLAGNAYSGQTGFARKLFTSTPMITRTSTPSLVKVPSSWAWRLLCRWGESGGGSRWFFARIRVTAPVQVAGTYTLFHPWGSETIVVTAADIGTKKAIAFTKDIA